MATGNKGSKGNPSTATVGGPLQDDQGVPKRPTAPTSTTSTSEFKAADPTTLTNKAQPQTTTVKVIDPSRLSAASKKDMKGFLSSSLSGNTQEQYRQDVKWRCVTSPVTLQTVGKTKKIPAGFGIVVTTGCAPDLMNVDKATYAAQPEEKQIGDIDWAKYNSDLHILVRAWLAEQDVAKVNTVVLPFVGGGIYMSKDPAVLKRGRETIAMVVVNEAKEFLKTSKSVTSVILVDSEKKESIQVSKNNTILHQVYKGQDDLLQVVLKEHQTTPTNLLGIINAGSHTFMGPGSEGFQGALHEHTDFTLRQHSGNSVVIAGIDNEVKRLGISSSSDATKKEEQGLPQQPSQKPKSTLTEKKKFKTEPQQRKFANDCAECAIEAAVEHLGLGRIYFDYVMTDIIGDQVDISPAFIKKDKTVDGQHWTDRTEVASNLNKLDKAKTYIVRTGVAGENGGGHWQILYFNPKIGWGFSNGEKHFTQLTDADSGKLSENAVGTLQLLSKDEWGLNPQDMRDGKPAPGKPAQRSILVVEASPEILMTASHFLAAYRITEADPKKPDAKSIAAIRAAHEFRELKNEEKKFSVYANFQSAQEIEKEKVEQEKEKTADEPVVDVKPKAPKPPVDPSIKQARWGIPTKLADESKPDFVSKKAAFKAYLDTKKGPGNEKYEAAKKWADPATADAEPADQAVKNVLGDIQQKAKMHSALEAQKTTDPKFAPDSQTQEIRKHKLANEQVVVMTAVVKDDKEMVHVYDDPDDSVFDDIAHMNKTINDAKVKITIEGVDYQVESRVSKSKPLTNVDFFLRNLASGQTRAVRPEDLKKYAAEQKPLSGQSLSEAVMNQTRDYMKGVKPTVYVHTQVREDSAYRTKYRP